MTKMTRGLALVCLVPVLAAAQQSKGRSPAARVRLSAVIAAFLADSGVPTRGLPWTTGSALPITWRSPAPVPNSDPNAARRGLTLTRIGTFMGTVGDSAALAMTISAIGSAGGLARVMIWIQSMEVTTNARGDGYFVTREMVEQALKNEGMSLQPLKCSRDKEGASYGNLVDAVKVPGKTASGLWWMWDSPRDGPTLTLTLLYRRADMGEVECAGTA
jgi:hypothetical protein